MTLEEGKIYHIYNRGINGTNLFYENRNYDYFLLKYAKYLNNVVETYAYCLLKNHFHLLIRVKENLAIINHVRDLSTNLKLLPLNGLHSYDKIVSKKFFDFFNSYTKSINISQNRTGGLFETPFKRILVDNDSYFDQLVWYIHFNPQKHGFESDYKNYQYSSYQSHLSNRPTKLARQDVLKWFGNKEEYYKFHEGMSNTNEISKIIFEME